MRTHLQCPHCGVGSFLLRFSLSDNLKPFLASTLADAFKYLLMDLFFLFLFLFCSHYKPRHLLKVYQL